MKFSQTPPTEPGLYWYRMAEDGRLYHTRVWRTPIDKVLVAAGADGIPKAVTGFRRWWSNEFLAEPEDL